MADKLDFSRKVADVRGASNVPVVEKNVSLEPTSTPNFQGAFQEFADANNSMSAIGARVAQASNNALAQQLGTESGRNPHGELGPSITEFDKNFAASYSAQANATLTIQADKLLSDARVKMSKPTRLTPELVAQTNAELAAGLNKIAQNAPSNVRPHLEASFASQLLSQNESYQNKMLGDQREDEKNNLINALDISTKQANELAIKGDAKGAERAVAAANEMAASGEANHYFTPQQARVARESTEQAAINGIYVNQAMQADKEGKLEAFEKNFAENKHGLSNEQWLAAGQAIKTQMNFIQGLRSQDQSLRMAKANLALAEHPLQIGSNYIADLQANLTAEQFAKFQTNMVTAVNKATKKQQAAQALVGMLHNSEAFSRATHDEKNDAFDMDVNHTEQAGKQSGQNITHPEAQLMVAMNSAGTIPKYVNQLKQDLSSTNPANISTAGESVERMFQSGNGNKLVGLGDEPVAMYEKFQALRTSMPDNEAAIAAHEIVYGKTPQQREANNLAWTDNVKPINKDLSTKTKFYLGQANIPAFSNLRNTTAYVRQMENTYETYFKLLNGDNTTALKMLRQNVAQTYGETMVNGKSEFTYLPIEKVLNLPEDSVGLIQADVSKQLNEQFMHTRQLYDAGRSDYYWEVRPKQNIEDIHAEINKAKSHGINQTLMAQEKIKQFNKGGGVEVLKHWRGAPVERYETVLQANPYSTMTTNVANPVSGGWEIMLKSEKGLHSIALLDNITGVVTYRPNAQKLQQQTALLHGWAKR